MSDLPPEWRDEDSSEYEVAAIAEFGAPPESFLGVPSYVLRVKSRQKELKRKVNELNELLSKGEAERDGAEAQLGQAALDFGLLPDMAEQIERKVAEAERSISAARGRSSKEAENHKKELERLDSNIAQVRSLLEPQEERTKQNAQAIEETETNIRQIGAMNHRLQIEHRNLEQSLSSNPSQPEVQSRLGQVGAELRKLQAIIHQEESKLSKLKEAQTAIDNELNPIRSKLESLEDARRKQIEHHEEMLGQHSKESRRAFAWRRSQLAVAGRKVYLFEERPRLTDADRLYARIEQSREKVAKYQADLELHLKALDAFDHEAFRKARYILIGISGVLAVLLLSLALYSC